LASSCESKAIENIGHGFEVWNEAVASIHDSVVLYNCRNGILMDSASNGQSLEGKEMMGIGSLESFLPLVLRAK
jgi:hypothetical protein